MHPESSNLTFCFAVDTGLWDIGPRWFGDGGGVILKGWLGCWGRGLQRVNVGSLVSRIGRTERRAKPSTVIMNSHLPSLREEVFSVFQNILQASWRAHGANLAFAAICAWVWE